MFPQNSKANIFRFFFSHSGDPKIEALQSQRNIDSKKNPISSYKLFLDMITLSANEMARSENFQKFLNDSRETFDVVIIETILNFEEILGLGYHFDAPVIGSLLVVSSSSLHEMSMMPAFPSFMPHLLLGYTDQMTFKERLINTIVHSSQKFLTNLLSDSSAVERYDRLFSHLPDKPTLKELKENVSLFLINAHPSISAARPLPPNVRFVLFSSLFPSIICIFLCPPKVFEVGGLAIKQSSEPLPIDLQRFIDEAEFGVIYFSFGTLVNLSKLPEIITMIAQVFKEFPTIRFLVKSENESIIKSVDNILVKSWFPQTTILSHPNVICFISHGGLNSVQESIYHAKPFIAIPSFFDHYMNARLAQQNGYGLSIPISELTAIKLTVAIEEMIWNPK